MILYAKMERVLLEQEIRSVSEIKETSSFKIERLLREERMPVQVILYVDSKRY